jgi:hypothetical protein
MLADGRTAKVPSGARELMIDHGHSVTYGKCVARKKVSTTVYITPEQDTQLKQLHARTKVPVAEYIRQGIDLVLEKYREHLPGQATLRFDGES